MLIGILSDPSRTEILLNNLSEAEFDLAEISVIMNDLKQRDTIAKDAGPLRGVHPTKIGPKLIKAGLSDEETAQCTQAVMQGKVLVVMHVAPESLAAAKEMFQDHSAQIIKE